MADNKFENLTITVYPLNEPSNRFCVVKGRTTFVTELVNWCNTTFGDATIARGICKAIESAEHYDHDYVANDNLTFHIEIVA